MIINLNLKRKRDDYMMNSELVKKVNSNMPMKKIDTKEIRKAIIDKDVTMVDISKRIDINVNTVSRWVNGKNLKNIESFINMLIFLDIDIKDVIK